MPHSSRSLVRSLAFIFGATTFALAQAPSFAQTPVLPEIEVSESAIIDFEFDWARDGTYCPTCNSGAGNSRLTFTDRDGNLWVGNVDPNTGDFYPPNGMGILVDTSAAFSTDFGNGPEWMNTADGSQIVYTKYAPGQPQNAKYAGVAIAKQVNGTWSGNIIQGGGVRHSPLASLDLNDPNPRINYQNGGNTLVYWRYVNDPSTENVMPLSKQTGGGSRRWVSGQHSIIFSAAASEGPAFQQVFLYNIDTDALEQLTFDSTTKWGAFMWQAPEFNNEYVFFTVANRTTIQIYRKLDDGTGTGTKKWTVVNSIAAPTNLPYIWSPEPFVFNGRSYLMMQVSSSSKANDFSVPTQIAMTGIDPAKATFRMLTNDSSTKRVRMDPEYFITSQGPFVYYNRYHLATADHKQSQDGVWRVDTKLGPPKTPAASVVKIATNPAAH